jgi:TonB-dependent receptor
MPKSIKRSSVTRALHSGVSVAAFCSVLLAAPAYSQDAEPAGQEEADEPLIVEGYKGSLTSAQSTKRRSDVIVDSISAEDIGALPDRSVTETLQRIPGVSIDRFSGGVDPDHFSTEGSGVTVRGLSYVRSEINGREAFTVSNGRGLSFADIPSELLFGVDVFKSPSANRIEGGIAGVVDLRTRRPFDGKGLVVSGSIENTYSAFAGKSAPAFSGLISNRWETGIGEIGILLSGSSSRLKTRSDKIQIGGFLPKTLYSNGNIISSPSSLDGVGTGTPVSRVYTPSAAGFGTETVDRKRYGLSGALQWRSNDGNIEAIVQYTRSDSRENSLENATDIAANIVNDDGNRSPCNGETISGEAGGCLPGTRAVPGTTLSFDDRGIFTNGVITAGTGWRADQGPAFGGNLASLRTPLYGMQANNISRPESRKYVTEDISANLRWKLSDNFSVNLDYQHVNSTVDLLSADMWMATYHNLAIDLTKGKYPLVQFGPPQVCNGPAANSVCGGPRPGGYIFTSHNYFGTTGSGATAVNHNSFTDPYNSYYYAAMDHAEENDGKNDAARIDFSYELPENNWIKGIEFGGRYSKREQTTRFSAYNWGALSQQWDNNGPVWLDNPNVAPNYTANTFPNYFGGDVQQPSPGSLFYSGNGALNYADYTAFATSVVNAWRAQGGQAANGQTGGGSGWVPLDQRPDAIPGSRFLPSEINPLTETNKAFYLMAKIDHNFANGWNLAGNVGVRYSRTNRVSSGFVTTPKASPDSTTSRTPAPGTVYVVPSTYDCNLTTDPDTGQPRQPSPLCTTTTATEREAIRSFFDGSSNQVDNKFDFDYILPSANFRLDTGNGLQFRVAYSKAVAPPDYGFVRSGFGVSFAGLGNDNDPFFPGSEYTTSRAGNPYLKPVESNNFDFSAEWYFNKNLGSLTFAAFYKELKGIAIAGNFPATITNNGVTLNALLNTAVNSSSTGNIKGVELGYNQAYTFLPGMLSGFGLSANATFIDQGSIEQGTLNSAYPNLASGNNPANTTLTDISKLPLVGLSKWNVNITPYYQKGPFEMRLAYSWRSKFLLTTQDVIFPYQPTFNNAAGYLDGSISLAVNKHFKLGLQASNLLDTITKTSAVIDRDARLTVPRSYFKSDRSYKIYARLTF